MATLKQSIIKTLKSLKLYSVVLVFKRLIAKLNIKHHKKTLQFYANFIKRGDLCFDIGANFGDRTKIFLELGAKVICVEPQVICLKHLHKSFRANKNVRIVTKALSDKEGYAQLAVCEDAPTISTISDKWQKESRFSQEYQWNTTQTVTTTTLDALIAQYGLPAFCKIDVEGFEESVLKGLTKPIPVISFEFNKELLDETKHCIDHLLSLGSVEFNCSLGESMELLLPQWVTPNELYAKINSQKDPLLWGDIYAKYI